jgi:DNA polymerase (family 10)
MGRYPECTLSGMNVVSNSQIADKLASLAQLLPDVKENFYKKKAYRRAAMKIKTMGESLQDLVHDECDLTQYPGIGQAISSAIQEIVRTGTLQQLESLRSKAAPELSALTSFPRLDPKRVFRVYKKLHISSIEELKEKLESGEIKSVTGSRMAQHIRHGITETRALLLYEAERICTAIESFLLDKCRVSRAQVVGDYRRRIETVEGLSFLIETDDFPFVISRLLRFGGHTPLLHSTNDSAEFMLSSEVHLAVHAASSATWGQALVLHTGSKGHLRKLASVTGNLKSWIHSNGPFESEESFYKSAGLRIIAPELREGLDEVERAAHDQLPRLLTLHDLRGELHAHTLSSDGSASIVDMAAAAEAVGYEYIGISDHSQSLKIANGVTEADLWKQIRFIDRLNEKSSHIRILKSAEVDILVDGTLDYSNELLRELDYTVCSIHSRFGQDKTQQTERIMRAMDNPYFNILGHPTGRLLLKRPGYEIDIPRLAMHAKQNGCCFEINASPDRLDLSAENARTVVEAGVKIAVSTDAHGVRDFGTARFGVDQARRAGIEKDAVLNALPWSTLREVFRR